MLEIVSGGLKKVTTQLQVSLRWAEAGEHTQGGGPDFYSQKGAFPAPRRAVSVASRDWLLTSITVGSRSTALRTGCTLSAAAHLRNMLAGLLHMASSPTSFKICFLLLIMPVCVHVCV